MRVASIGLGSTGRVYIGTPKGKFMKVVGIMIKKWVILRSRVVTMEA